MRKLMNRVQQTEEDLFEAFTIVEMLTDPKFHPSSLTADQIVKYDRVFDDALTTIFE